MQELKKTTCFVVTAAVLGVAAIGNSWLSQPATTNESELVGKEFFPDFVTTEAARSLEVAAIDPESGSLKRFGVKSDGDLWRIPTHYDYPAEAAARIAQTSASVMGLKAEANVGMSESEFEKFGVVDPLSDDIEDPETAGKRITLLDENGDALVDYIIGKEIEDNVPTRGGDEFEMQSNSKDFYIRRAEDSQTFRVSLNIDLSTKFSDWIDPDLLRINRPDVTQVLINNYKIEERGSGAFGMKQLSKIQGDQLELSRPSPTDSWNLAGMDPTKEEIQTDRINEILGVLDEMAIVGVRPKFKYKGKQLLTPELTPADIEELTDNREKANAYGALQDDLIDKGFNLAGTQQQLELVSENGELEFGTSKGLRYRLHVGGVFADKDESIEIGSDDDAESTEETATEQSTDDANRFVYVRVTFDESLLGDRPTEPKLPTAPVKPEGYEPVAADTAQSADAESDSGEEAESKPEDESKSDSEGEDAEKEGDEKKPSAEERNPQFAMYEEALAEFEKATSEHEMNLTRYKQDNEAFDEKIKEGKELVDELNQRFGDWYYVISASNLNTIQSTRSDLLKPGVSTTPTGGAPGMPPAPGISIPNLPGGGTFKTPEEAQAAVQKMLQQAEAEANEDSATAEKPAIEGETTTAPKEAESAPEAKTDGPTTGADGEPKPNSPETDSPKDPKSAPETEAEVSEKSETAPDAKADSESKPESESTSPQENESDSGADEGDDG